MLTYDHRYFDLLPSEVGNGQVKYLNLFYRQMFATPGAAVPFPTEGLM